MANPFAKKPPFRYRGIAAILSALFSVQISMHFIKDIRYLLIAIPAFVLIYVCFCREYFDSSKEISIPTQKKENARMCRFISFLIILTGQMFYLGAFFPGGFNLDTLNQWYQIHSELPVSNWHSPLVTFFYWLITRVSDSIAVCVTVQIILFSLAASLLISEIYKQYISQRLAIILSVWIAINPAIGRINVSLVKDVYFSIFSLFAYFLLLRIIGTDGSVLSKNISCLLLALLLSCIVLVRHNGVLMSAAISLALFLCYKKYRPQLIRTILLSCLLIFLTEGPIYHLLGVAPHSNIVGEAAGIPMSVMTNALINDPENIPSDVVEFMHSIEPDDSIWRSNYTVGEWDSCKWTIGEGSDDGMLLSDVPLSKILILSAKTIIACPNTSYQSIRENTRIAWQIIGPCNWLPYVFQEDNPYGITYNSVGILASLESKVFSLFSRGPLCIYHWNTGLQISVLLLLFLRCIKKGNARKGILVFPLLIYDIGTSLIIAGPNYRYFYLNAVLFLPIAFYMFCEIRSDQ